VCVGLGCEDLFVARKAAGVKTPVYPGVTARLKSCPVTKHFSNRVQYDELSLSK
jgi:hypothetical protein